MDRVSPSFKRRRFQLGIAALSLGLAFLAGTCDNPVDLLGEVEVKVMKANDRYLEVESIRALSVLSDQSVSPGTLIEIHFDRPFDADTVLSALSIKRQEDRMQLLLLIPQLLQIPCVLKPNHIISQIQTIFSRYPELWALMEALCMMLFLGVLGLGSLQPVSFA